MANSILSPIKPCIKCGACERNTEGRCKPCTKARSDAWLSANAGKKKASRAAWQAAHLDIARAHTAAWAKANPEALRIKAQNRRARLRSAEGSITKADVTWLFDLQRGMCPVCKADLNDGYHVDHIQALSKGGSNARANLQLLCPTCNMSKSSKDPIDFMQERGFLL